MVMMKMSSTVFCFCILCGCLGTISGSAIPMWEYLSKDEKMSYLYVMFSTQVTEYCAFMSENKQNCREELMKFGLRKLKGMPEDHLDTMDPYQRGANSIIWDSMMEGHEIMKTNQKPAQSTTTAKPNSFEDSSFDEETYRLQSAASAKIDNVYRVPPPKGFVYVAPNSQYTISTGVPQYKYPDSTRFGNNQYAAPTQQQQTNNNRRVYEEVPLTGPMVIKVYPDGTPVHNHQPSIPHDEDLNQYKQSKVRIPNL